MDFGFEGVQKARFAELLAVLGPDDDGAVDGAAGTW